MSRTSAAYSSWTGTPSWPRPGTAGTRTSTATRWSLRAAGSPRAKKTPSAAPPAPRSWAPTSPGRGQRCLQGSSSSLPSATGASLSQTASWPTARIAPAQSRPGWPSPCAAGWPSASPLQNWMPTYSSGPRTRASCWFVVEVSAGSWIVTGLWQKAALNGETEAEQQQGGARRLCLG